MVYTAVKFGWKDGSRISADAEAVGQELAEIEKAKAGRPTAADVLAFAKRHKSSELHKCFPWDDQEAAEKYRLQQAGYIMRCIVYEEVTTESGAMYEDIRVYESVEYDDERTYMNTAVILEDDDLRQIVFGEIRDGIVALAAKMRKYESVVPNAERYQQMLTGMAEELNAVSVPG